MVGAERDNTNYGCVWFSGWPLGHLRVNRGRTVSCIVRSTSDRSGLEGRHLQIVQADLLNPQSLQSAFTSAVHTVVHCAATTSETRVDYAQSFKVNVEGTRYLLELSHRAGVERFIMISTQSANQRNPSTYARTKLAADELVRQSPLAYTILKPSTIYGPGTKGLFAKMVRLLDKLPVVPVLSTGQRLIRPIHVFDLCEAVLECEASGQTINKTYDLGGRDLLVVMKTSCSASCRPAEKRSRLSMFRCLFVAPLPSLSVFSRIHLLRGITFWD